ncbi:hypothetical protein ACFXHA_18120 [Nocardia sp. NPDC059240]|uniref:hypothetical protein n=1 Tax=Nocardia sp. NPDC059240 TaxID=3346786 RepID=UPI0036A192FC
MPDPMALEFMPWTIRSDKSPEIAFRTTLSMDSWMLTWLPDRMLTLEQAAIGMGLDEVLSDPAPADAEDALEVAEMRAAQLGLTLREVVVLLWVRSAERDRKPEPAGNACTAAPLGRRHGGARR